MRFPKYHQAILFGLVYIAIILIFSLLYYALYDDFHYYSIQHEESTKDLEHHVHYLINEDLSDYFGRLDKINSYESLTDDLKKEQARITALERMNGSVSLDDTHDMHYYRFINVENVTVLVDQDAYTIGFDLIYDEYAIAPVSKTSIYHTREEVQVDDKTYALIVHEDKYKNVLLGTVCDRKIAKATFDGYLVQFAEPQGISLYLPKMERFMSRRTEFKLNEYMDIINCADDNYLFSKYSRMLYLSMVTITTLGYGDIIPLTTLTRILVGVEAVLGILILGAFATVLFGKSESTPGVRKLMK